MRKNAHIPAYATFDALYCSGWFIDQPKFVTAAALLFEHVHFTNEARYIQQFARNYQGDLAEFSRENELSAPKIRVNGSWEPLYPFHTDLSEEQVRKVFRFSLAAKAFWSKYEPLIGTVFMVNPNSNVFFELHEDTNYGNLGDNRSPNSASQSRGVPTSFEEQLAAGAIPLFGTFPASFEVAEQELKRSTSLAAALAQRGVALTLPDLQPVTAEVILEARAKLQDELAAYWAEMLRLSKFLKEESSSATTSEEFGRMCDDFINENVRPHLINLSRKMRLERRNWAFKLLGPVGKGLALILTQAPPNPSAVLTGVAVAGREIIPAVAESLMAQPQPVLSYLVDLEKPIAERSR